MRKKCKNCQYKHMGEFRAYIAEALVLLAAARASFNHAKQEGKKGDCCDLDQCIKKLTKLGPFEISQCNAYIKCLNYIQMAAVFDAEASLGYPDFRHYVEGYLSLAAMSVVGANPELASALRGFRLNTRKREEFELFCNYVLACINLGNDYLELPEELL